MKILTTIGALLLSATFLVSQENAGTGPAVTSVAGESWLQHIHRSFGDTRMGKTWRLGPSDLSTDESSVSLPLSAGSESTTNGSPTRLRTLHGSDLYRMNCQGCHGESGLGAPPEIGSLIDPVRSTSAKLVEQRMKNIGMEMDRRQIAEMASQSKAALLKRLHEGGTDMPSFHHLSEAEIHSLVAYLQLLAGIPGAEERQIAIQESHARVGELIAKSTCHTCHAATGTNPTPAELLEGAIPALIVLPERVDRAQLVRKVTRGAHVIMGTTPAAYRGRMPVFNYLSEDEAADVYDYLRQYPPSEAAQVAQAPEPSSPDQTDPPNKPREAEVRAAQIAPSQIPASHEPAESVVLPVSVGVLVVALLLSGCWFTVKECKRLAAESAARRALRRAPVVPGAWATLRSKVDLLTDPEGFCAAPMHGDASVWMDERQIS